MNVPDLPELIRSEMTRQRVSFDVLDERSHARGYGLSASYFCMLVKKPLTAVTLKMVAGVTAALAPSEEDMPAYRERVLLACWSSWGFSVQRLPSSPPADTAIPTLPSECVVISTVGLTTAQALEVQRVADNAIKRMEVSSNGAGERDLTSSARAPVFSYGLPNPRPKPDDRDGSNGIDGGPTPDNFPRIDRSQAAS